MDHKSLAPPFILFILLLFTIFLIPFLPEEAYSQAYVLFLTAIALVSVFVIEKRRKINLILAVLVIAIRWSAIILSPEDIDKTAIIQIAFFLWIVVQSLLQITDLERTRGHALLDAINGYMVLILVAAFLIGLISFLRPGSFTFGFQADKPIEGMNEYIYHAIVVFTSTGFGDIRALTPEAKAISNFVSVLGQLYVAIIMAMLISHYISMRKKGHGS